MKRQRNMQKMKEHGKKTHKTKQMKRKYVVYQKKNSE